MAERRLDPLGIHDDELLTSHAVNSCERRFGFSWSDPVSPPFELLGPGRIALRLSPDSEANIEAATRELELLGRFIGMMLNAASDSRERIAYVERTAAGPRNFRVVDYLVDRDAFFKGSYPEYRELSRRDLEASKQALRAVILPRVAARTSGDWREAQEIFYAWVRKAYEAKLGGANRDIRAMIMFFEKLPRLGPALARVRVSFGGDFYQEDFLPRPLKLNGGFRLGTLSDHALGTAVDVEPARNPQIDARRWDRLWAYTGVAGLDHASRQANWKSNPGELHRAIVSMSDLFVRKLNQALGERARLGLSDKQAMVAILQDDAHLQVSDEEFLKQWRQGFFSLPWELVKSFHEVGFIWGASFKNVDLHHFELPNGAGTP